jgi:hypothetical protein
METRRGWITFISVSVLTSDSDGDAFEDGVEAERGDEEYAVAEGAGVAQHGCGGVIAVCVLYNTIRSHTVGNKQEQFSSLTGMNKVTTDSDTEFRGCTYSYSCLWLRDVAIRAHQLALLQRPWKLINKKDSED